RLLSCVFLIDSGYYLTTSFSSEHRLNCFEVRGPIAVPHLVPLVMVMEGEDPVENGERGCEVLYNVLQAARSWEPVPELLEAFRTEFALRLFWGQQGAVADKKERYEKFDKILCVLSNKLEPVEVTPQQPGALT
ncbi:hypothetical protein GOODEAATRI_014928, partial [Goodea atripinnis]